uniref:response regulator transcription factor n=1 Tax=Cephaloticoccus sp. TaxID=1985742 RepID=UPI004049C141
MSWRDFSASAAINAPLLEKLSPAEQAVALQLAQGLSNAEIARLLGKSKFTVKSQVSSILTKLGVPTRGRLIAILR